MSIRLLRNNEPIEVSFIKVGEVYEAEYPWETGEDYTLEIDTQTLDADGVTIRLPGEPEAHRRLADESVPKEPLDIAPQLNEIWPDENLPHPANAETIEKFTTTGSIYSFKITAGWGESRFMLHFRPRKWSREYIIRRA